MGEETDFPCKESAQAVAHENDFLIAVWSAELELGLDSGDALFY
jgi:hypothetical protein